MGAEDFSYVLQQRPGAMSFLGVCPPGEHPSRAHACHSNRMMMDEDAMPRRHRDLRRPRYRNSPRVEGRAARQRRVPRPRVSRIEVDVDSALVDRVDTPALRERVVELRDRNTPRAPLAALTITETQHVDTFPPIGTAVARLSTYRARPSSSKTWNKPQSSTVSNCSPSDREIKRIMHDERNVEAALTRFASRELDRGRRRVDAHCVESTRRSHDRVFPGAAADMARVRAARRARRARRTTGCGRPMSQGGVPT